MNKLLQWLRGYWYVVCGCFAGLVFLNAMLTHGSHENPAAVAGWSAAMLAMCVGAIALAEAAYRQGQPVRRAPGVFLGVVAIAGAYLWIADEVGVHPADPMLFGAVGVLWIAVAVFAFAVSMILLIARNS